MYSSLKTEKKGQRGHKCGDGIEDGSRECAKDGYVGERQVNEEKSMNEEREGHDTNS